MTKQVSTTLLKKREEDEEVKVDLPVNFKIRSQAKLS